jgi:phosphotransferase system enzyme I (PtsI)
VDFVADHLLVTLTGTYQSEEDPPLNSIVVTHDLSPADTARLYRAGIRGFITEVGGRTSHTSIIARSLGLPSVAGVHNILDLVGNGDRLLIDGFNGEVLLDPEAAMIRQYERRMGRRAKFTRFLRRERELPAETTDGLRIHLLANIELSDEIPTALAHGAEGVGLYRTEFLYLGREQMPNEEDHLKDALHVFQHSIDVPVTFRTCDLGIDKIPGGLSLPEEINPSLGLRSIRLCLERKDMFKAQLRGLLRAALKGDMRIMFPMVTGVEVFRKAKAVVLECEQELREQGIPFRHVPLGVMIEMPSAVMTADLLAQEVDFFSIGTNDLTQYALAIDRVNEQVNYLFQPYHPAVLRMIAQVVQAAERVNIPVAVCGEIAGDPLMILLLMGMGIRQLSMNALAMPAIKRLIRISSGSEAVGLAQRVLCLSTPEEVAAEVRSTMQRLFPEDKQLMTQSEDLDEEPKA